MVELFEIYEEDGTQGFFASEATCAKFSFLTTPEDEAESPTVVALCMHESELCNLVLRH